MGAERRDPALGPDDAYRPPAANLEFADRAAPEAVAIREAHVGHERQLKSVGLLFGLGTVGLLLTLLALLLPGDDGGPGTTRQMAGVIGGGLLLGLLAIPLGTLLHGYILYLVWCAKGRRVLAPDYAAIIRATPQVRYKRTRGDWIVFALLLLLVAGFGATLLFA